MNEIISEVLNLLEKNGFEAYIVGGFVRDKILKIKTKDVDIITNAKPQEIYKIFKNNVKIDDNYGSVKIIYEEYNIDITTYRKDYYYKNNKPTKVEYINDVKEDLKRRDFTINTLLMDKNSKIYDYMKVKKDVTSHIIKVVGSVNEKFSEDKTRILRALRFMTTLNFKLDLSISQYIINNKKYFYSINYSKKREELDKIFVSPNIKKFLKYIKKYELEKYLEIYYNNNLVITSTIIGIWAQMDYSEKYPFNKIEKKQIENIREIIDKKTITRYDVYKYGPYICMIASEILKKNKKNIDKIYHSISIKSIKDINISSEEICSILNITPSKRLGQIYIDIEKNIVNRKLSNKKEDIIKYLKGLKNE